LVTLENRRASLGPTAGKSAVRSNPIGRGRQDQSLVDEFVWLHATFAGLRGS